MWVYSKKESSDERGLAPILLVAAVVVIGSIIGVGILVAKHSSKKPTTTTNTPAVSSSTETSKTDQPTDLPAQQPQAPVQSQSNTSTLAVNARNTKRKDDAARLLTGALEYATNNSGQMPNLYEEGHLRGTSDQEGIKVVLEQFIIATVEYGEQPPLAGNGVRLVVAATCNKTDGAALPGTSRQIVVQYGLEQTNGDFTAACQEG